MDKKTEPYEPTLEEVYEKWQSQPPTVELWAEMSEEIDKAMTKEPSHTETQDKNKNSDDSNSSNDEYEKEKQEWECFRAHETKKRTEKAVSWGENGVTFLSSKQEEKDYIEGKTSSIIV